MSDPQDVAEQLDDDKIGDPAPDKLLGAQAYGAAGAEPHAVESVARRAAREEPELRPIPGEPDPVDETLGDTALERSAPVAAEEAAMHLVDAEPEVVGEVLDPEVLEDDDLRAPDAIE